MAARPSKHKTASGHAHAFAKEKERLDATLELLGKNFERTRLLSNPSQELVKWARGGLLNEVVLRSGDIGDLEKLVRMGAKFEHARWNNAYQAICDKPAHHQERWLTLLFDNGWTGQGGTPEPLMVLAEEAPALAEKLWSTKAPRAWHTRRNWLDGRLVPDAHFDAHSAKAWIAMGATPGHATAQALDRWIGGDWEKTKILPNLLAIDEALQEDKARRRVRGEPAWRDWPWEDTFQVAIKRGYAPLVFWLCDHKGHADPTPSEAMRLLAHANEPEKLMEQIKQRQWRLPNPRSPEGHDAVRRAIVDYPNGYLVVLLREGFFAPMDEQTRAAISKARLQDEIKALIGASELAQDTPSIAPSAPARASVRL